MKKTTYIFMLSWTFLSLFTMCKNPGIDYLTFSITKENIQPGLHSVMALGEYDFPGEIMSMKLNIGLEAQLADADIYPVDLENQSFAVKVEELKPGTSYYYCYVIEFDKTHKMLTEVGTFTTLSDKPLVRTLGFEKVDSVSFNVKCIVENDFGMPITERGICWNHSGEPTCEDSTVIYSENGTGEYDCLITGLELNRFYFVRAYAMNEMGLSYANEVLGFQTDPFELPTVETLSVEDITPTTAVCRGKIVNEGSSAVHQRYGILLGTTPDFSVDGEYYSGNSDEGSFHVNFADLSPNTTYYYCAYATNGEGTGCGDTLEFTTLSPNGFEIIVSCSPAEGGLAEGNGYYEAGEQCIVTATPNSHFIFLNWTEDGEIVCSDKQYSFIVERNQALVANFIPTPEGGIDALFSVGPSSQVYIARGNLQYRASTGTFQFAEHQWDVIGLSNSNISPNNSEWIDLFGWGTGGDPTNTGTINTFLDWGNNLISNGGNTSDLWRTMSYDEWNCLLNERDASSIGGVENARYVKATVNDIEGIVLFPDVYENPSGILIQTNTINNPNVSFDNNNNYSESQWSIMEGKGCVFLPVTGNRDDNIVQYLDNGYYWSSSSLGLARSAYGLHFDDTGLQTDLESALKIGESVRLVHEYRGR